MATEITSCDHCQKLKQKLYVCQLLITSARQIGVRKFLYTLYKQQFKIILCSISGILLFILSIFIYCIKETSLMWYWEFWPFVTIFCLLILNFSTIFIFMIFHAAYRSLDYHIIVYQSESTATLCELLNCLCIISARNSYKNCENEFRKNVESSLMIKHCFGDEIIRPMASEMAKKNIEDQLQKMDTFSIQHLSLKSLLSELNKF